ncbi:response regulator transcription factor [Novosphingobium aquimarinum]|uniref:response regulator transcription factor n=1 Tax=Novosphingobium aquimarinum TaxID=2682494 RepID=UPI0018DD756A|nr:LuxR C-terminal-related transcriptional regulator [Novosphingobium aquimarinum]
MSVFVLLRVSSRRAEICRELTGDHFVAMPVEDLEDMLCKPPETGLLLFDSRELSIDSLTLAMDTRNVWLPFVAIGENPSASDVVSCMRAGAIDFIDLARTENNFAHQIANAVSALNSLSGVRYRQYRARRLLASLTSRERQVLDGMANGKSSKSLAAELSISYRTVEAHRTNMLRKMNASSFQAIRIAIEAAIA